MKKQNITEEAVIELLKTIYDPEISIDIYELGLIYRIDVSNQQHIEIDMTLTSPACPVAGQLPKDVEEKVLTLSGVDEVTVTIVWQPSWQKHMISESGQLTLGLL